MSACRYRLVYRPRTTDGFPGGPGNPVSHSDIGLLLRHAFLRRNADLLLTPDSALEARG